MKQILKNIKIVDFSHRLPGPYASYLLAQLGADIIKIEDEKFKDPFITGLFPSIDPSFSFWYDELNRNKNIHRIDFNAVDAKKEVSTIISDADAIILALPEKVVTKLQIKESLEKSKDPKVCIELVASLNNKKSHLHDLNALAETGILALHIAGRKENFINPPLLPIAGVAFGNQIALQLLASLLKAEKTKTNLWEKVGLLESTETLIAPFWSEKLKNQTSFLHNGRYPCYGIYRTKDNRHIALAAVEDKFWKLFCELFSLGELDAFDLNEKGVRTKVIDLFSNLTLEQILASVGNHEICLSVT